MKDLDELFPAEDPQEVAEAEDAGDAAPGQETLFGDDRELHVAWSEWRGMPEFVQEDLTPVRQIIVNFATTKDVDRFSELLGQTFTRKTRSIWYPEAEIGRFADKRYKAPPEDST